MYTGTSRLQRECLCSEGRDSQRLPGASWAVSTQNAVFMGSPLEGHVSTFKNQHWFPNAYQLTCPASQIYNGTGCKVASLKLEPWFDSETIKVFNCNHIMVLWDSFRELETFQTCWRKYPEFIYSSKPRTLSMQTLGWGWWSWCLH